MRGEMEKIQPNFFPAQKFYGSLVILKILQILNALFKLKGQLSPSYRNQSLDFYWKTVYWFLHSGNFDVNGLRLQDIRFEDNEGTDS